MVYIYIIIYYIILCYIILYYIIWLHISMYIHMLRKDTYSTEIHVHSLFFWGN